jgi:hypothetical protein
VGFDSVVFADRASLAALSCFSRLKAERDAGRRCLILALVDQDGAAAISSRGLAEVRALADFSGSPQALRERIAVEIRRHDPRHVAAPLGLLGAHPSVDYFTTLRATMNVEKGRDLLFFEERPNCLVPEAVPLRLSALGARLPPASELRSPRRYGPFRMRLVMGLVPPIFGSVGERWRLSRSLKPAFRDAFDWDPHKALGPKLQPVVEPWREGDTADLFELADALGLAAGLGSSKVFARRMVRHAASGGGRTPMERCWLSLPGAQEPDPISDAY